MRSAQSHGRLIGIVAVLLIPTGIGFGAGIWLTDKYQASQQLQEGQVRRDSVTFQAQLLVDMVLQEIESIHTQANAILEPSLLDPMRDPVLPSGKILHWAELRVRENTFQGVKQMARNRFWNGNPDIEQAYLNAAMETLDPREIFKDGIAILRMRQDRNGASEWLSFAFPSLAKDKSIVMALINPSQSFLAFQRWASYQKMGRFRSYLIGNDGRVLAHSQRALVSADFGRLPLFEEGIRKIFRTSTWSGAGDYLGIDQVPVEAAYVRLKSLPLAVVVEEVSPTLFNPIDTLKWLGSLFLALAAVATSIFGVALILKFSGRVPEKSSRQPFWQLSSRKADAGQLLSEADIRLESGKVEQKFFKGDEVLVLDSLDSLGENNFRQL